MSAGSFASLPNAYTSRGSLLAAALLATTALCASAAADFPATIELSALDGTTGFRIDGIDNGDFAGWSVAAADVNGDGFDDVVIGARGADPGGDSYAGEVYVVFGRPSFPAALALSGLDGTNGFRLDGIDPVDQAGNAVANAGDVNGDGFADILIGAYAADLPAGESYVVFGKPGPFAAAMSLSDLNGTNGFRIDGISGYSGNSVSGAGDHNGDGFDDVLIGASRRNPGGKPFAGESYVVFGRGSFPPALALSSLNGTNGYRLEGAEADDFSGTAVAGGGDFDNDGFDDILIGAPFADTPPPAADSRDQDGGEAYLVPGRPLPFDEVTELDKAGEAFGILLQGVALSGIAGKVLNASGKVDFNRDGLADFMVGAPGVNGDEGEIITLFGKADSALRTITPRTIQLDDVDGTVGFRLEGGNSGDLNGSAATGGDFNADGFSDLASGAPRAAPGGRSDAGRSYVLFGHSGSSPPAINVSTLDGDNGFALNGAAPGDNSGSALAAGDVNGDGVDDLIIGARGNIFGSGPGKVFVVFGRVPDEAVTRRGSAADQYISGGPFADRLFGLAGNDRLEGRGGPDQLTGGSGNRDFATYLHAPSGTTVNLGSPAANTGDAAGDTYTGIEGIEGSRFNDRLIGNELANTLIGGFGRDRMTGRLGPDIFDFNDVLESVPGTLRDHILGFEAGTATTSIDRIDLSDIDANPGVSGNQAFKFIGTAPFSGAAGELRAAPLGNDTRIIGDVNGDKIADLEILLNNTTAADINKVNFRL